MQIKINVLIKILIVLGLISYMFIFDYDYKTPLFFLILAYLIGSIILNPLLQSNYLKFFVYLTDLVMLSYFSYATGNIYFSLFYYLLLVYENSFKHTIILILISLPVVFYNYYQTNFYDIVYILLFVGMSLFVFKNVLYSKKLEEEKLKNVSIFQESFLNFLKCKSKLDYYKKYYEINTTLNLFKRDRISPETLNKFLYENLNADCVIVYDTYEDECYISGDNLDCKKVLTMIEDEKLYINENINKEFGYKYILFRKINHIFLILFYKEFILDEEEIIKLIQ